MHNQDKERKEFDDYLRDWECQGLALPKWEHSPEPKKRGGIFGKFWTLLKTVLDSLGSYF